MDVRCARHLAKHAARLSVSNVSPEKLRVQIRPYITRFANIVSRLLQSIGIGRCVVFLTRWPARRVTRSYGQKCL
jgi:hypothetical protein